MFLLAGLFAGSMYQGRALALQESGSDQRRTVQGVVRDASDQLPLPGVTVMEKGTRNGTVTDLEGRFSITVENDASVLEISFTGYERREIPVRDQTELSISLSPDIQNLDEVVVIGYGTARVKDLTGSVSRVSEKDFNQGINVSPDQLIQGKVAGVDIINNSGAPGSAVTFRIRGASSIRSGNQPLFVVDGVPLDGRNTKPGAAAGEIGTTPGSNPLSFINPDDIATIDILKDASATAIYGARGANGVVIITTKKGRAGALSLNLDISAGISSFLRTPDIMDAGTFRQALDQRGLENMDGGASVNAFDAIMRTAPTQVYNLSVSGGSEKATYRLSAGYHDQDGIVQETGLRKYMGSFTGGFKFLQDDRLRIDLSLVASTTNEQGGPIAENSNVYGSLIGNAIEWNPTVPLRNAEGDFVQRLYDEAGVSGLPTNPLALIAYYNDKSDVTNVLGTVSAAFRITDGLDYRLSLGVNHAKGDRVLNTSGELFLSTITGVGLSVANTSQLTSSTLTHTLNYQKELAAGIRFDLLGGYELQTYKRYITGITARGFTLFEVDGTDILQNPSNDNVQVSSFRDPTNELQSWFGRLNLNFSDKYLLTGTFRADGSTKFGRNNRYGYFPSFAGAWVLSEEPFMSDLVMVDNLKLRIGWGQTGNQEFPTGAARERYAFGQEQIALENVANPDLRWETTETLNIGIEFSLLDHRLSGSVEYFDKQTRDLLFQLPALQPAPAAKYWANLPARVENSGVELALNAVLVDKPASRAGGQDLWFELGVNATFLDNRFSDYSGVPVLTGQINGNGLGGGSNSQRLANGQPLFAFYMPEFLGFDENGTAMYTDDSRYVGDPNPDVLLGMNTALNAGKFGLNLNFNGVFGHQLYNNTANALITAANFALGRNTSGEIGLGNENLGNANVVSTRFLENGNYLRLRNATISYHAGHIGNTFRNVRFSLTGQNLFVITKYSGFDPEVNTNREVDGVPSSGIEYIPYPTARSFMLGINVSF